MKIIVFLLLLTGGLVLWRLNPPATEGGAVAAAVAGSDTGEGPKPYAYEDTFRSLYQEFLNFPEDVKEVLHRPEALDGVREKARQDLKNNLITNEQYQILLKIAFCLDEVFSERQTRLHNMGSRVYSGMSHGFSNQAKVRRASFQAQEYHRQWQIYMDQVGAELKGYWAGYLRAGNR